MRSIFRQSLFFCPTQFEYIKKIKSDPPNGVKISPLEGNQWWGFPWGGVWGRSKQTFAVCRYEEDPAEEVSRLQKTLLKVEKSAAQQILLKLLMSPSL